MPGMIGRRGHVERLTSSVEFAGISAGISMYGLGRQAGKAAIAQGEGAPGARRNEELTIVWGLAITSVSGNWGFTLVRRSHPLASY